MCSTNRKLSKEDDDEEVIPELIFPKYAWQVKTNRFYPTNTEIDATAKSRPLQLAQKWVSYNTKMDISFPLATTLPKVQRVLNVPRRELPRDVEIERKQKFYWRIKLDKCLEHFNISIEDLVPPEIIKELIPEMYSPENIFFVKTFLPLEFFDNESHEIRSVENWLNLGLVKGVPHPLSAVALLPNVKFENTETDVIENVPDLLNRHFSQNKNNDDFLQNLFCWRTIAVNDYDENTDKWIISDLSTFNTYKIPRIYLRFTAENPFHYVERLQDALNSRKICENMIKFDIAVEALILLSNLDEYNETFWSRICTIAISKKKLRIFDEEFVNGIKHEINTTYQRIMMKFEFRKFLADNPIEFGYFKYSVEPTKRTLVFPWISLVDNYKVIRNEIKFRLMWYKLEIISAMSKLSKEFLDVEQLNLFTYPVKKPVPLSDFISTLQYNSSAIMTHIKGHWIDSNALHLCLFLRNLGKGSMELISSDWYMYRQTKLIKLLQQIKYRMESSLRFCLIRSVRKFVKILTKSGEGLMDIDPNNYEWPSNFKTNPYEQMAPPIFYLTLDISLTGAFYSTKPEDFLPAILDIYHTTLVQTCTVGLIDSQVTTNLVYAKNLYLDVGDEIDELYHEQKSFIKKCYELFIIPLKAYAVRWNIFIDLHELNLTDFISDLKASAPDAVAIKDMIVKEKDLTDDLKDILPIFIVIGPFYINCDPLRKFLIEKRVQTVNALFNFYVDRLYDINDALLSQYNIIYSRLREKSTNIEHVLNVKAYITTLPDHLVQLKKELKQMIIEYDMLDVFFYNLSDEQFVMKWNAFASPLRIDTKITDTHERHKIDTDLFMKRQFMEMSQFESRMETLNEEVSQFILHTDASKTAEIAVDAINLWTTLKKNLEFGNLLRSRQKIFELDDISMEYLESIIEKFEPYYNLWKTCQNFLQQEEICLSSPLLSLDVEAIKNKFAEISESLLQSLIVFEEKPEIKSVAEIHLNKIKAFQPSMDIIECVRNVNWVIVHWQEFAQRTKSDIKFSPVITLGFCVKKGILDAHPVIMEICQRAIQEAAELQRQLEEMEMKKQEQQAAIAVKKIFRKARMDIM